VETAKMNRLQTVETVKVYRYRPQETAMGPRLPARRKCAIAESLPLNSRNNRMRGLNHAMNQVNELSL
jgi:hypothetical protein